MSEIDATISEKKDFVDGSAGFSKTERFQAANRAGSRETPATPTTRPNIVP